MKQQITHIEGLEGEYQDVEMVNDTPLGVTHIEFFPKSEQVFKDGKYEFKNFVWIKKVVNLGNLIIERRIRDAVEFDDNEKRWKIKELERGDDADGTPRSDIRRYASEWNAFARGSSLSIVGTPLEMIFRHDPTKVLAYKSKHVHTIEQLKSLTDSHIQELGLGAREDRELAVMYLDKIEKARPALEINNRFEQLEAQLAAKNREVSELTAKLTQLLQSHVDGLEKEAKKAPKKSKVKQQENLTEGEE